MAGHRAVPRSFVLRSACECATARSLEDHSVRGGDRSSVSRARHVAWGVATRATVQEAGSPRTGPEAGHSLAAVILGNDALVAARPHSPAQVANACWAAGYDVVVPPGWGDEVVAAAYLEQLARQSERVLIACACPRVATLLGQTPAANVRRVAIAPPPVAAARSLRAAHGDEILITYVGDCPGAKDPSIDIRFSPLDLFSHLGLQGITVADQPAVLEGDLVDRWRRYYSVPGGLPALRFLGRPPVERVLRIVDLATLAQNRIPPSRSNILVDLADAAQCVCGGARDQIEECEPPRHAVPIVARPPGVSMVAEPTARPPRVVRLHGPPRAPIADAVASGPVVATDDGATPGPVAERPADAVATKRGHGPSTHPPEHRASDHKTRALPRSRPSRGPSSGSPRRAARRAVVVAAAPAIVLALVAALGVGVYAASSSGGRGTLAPAEIERGHQDDDRATDLTDGDLPADVAPEASPSGPGAAGEVIADSLVPLTGGPAMRHDTSGSTSVRSTADSVARDSIRRAGARRRMRAGTVEVVPGWMPQGLPKFTPTDPASRRADTMTKAPAPPDTSSRSP